MLRRYLFGAAMLIGLSACDTTSTPQGPGSLSIFLTDAPGDLVTAVVTIDRIYLQGGDEEVVLMDTPTTTNLLELQNEVLALVNDVTVPGGSYSQLRLEISGGYIEVVEEEDGGGIPTATTIYASSAEYAAAQGVSADGTLHMPSYASSGLKINLPGGSVEVDGDQEIILLDFDVAESFGREAGNSGRWVLSPVVRASDFATSVGVELSLALADSVTLPELNGEPVTLADFGATLTKGGDILSDSFEETSGTFKANFYFLEAGVDYPVAFVAPAGLTATLDPVFPASVEVASGTLKLSFEITGVAVE